MSTEFVVAEDVANELSVIEQSSLFSLTIWPSAIPFADDVKEHTIYDLTPEQLAAAGAELIKIASYHMGVEKLQEAINQHIKDKGGWIVGVSL